MDDDALVFEYLKRIEWWAPDPPPASFPIEHRPPPTLRTLQRLVLCHVTHVPFENLDIVLLGRPIAHSIEDAVRKVVLQRRGGFCFELNTAFSWLLARLGFDDIRFQTARVWRNGAFSVLNSHICLTVRVPEVPERLLTDVGFTLAAPCPLRLVDDEVQADEYGTCGHRFVLRRVRACDGWDLATADCVPGVLSAESIAWRLFDIVPGALARPTPSRADYRSLVVPEDARTSDWENLLIELAASPVSFEHFRDAAAFMQRSTDTPFATGLICTRRCNGGRGRVSVTSGIWAGDAPLSREQLACVCVWKRSFVEAPGAPPVISEVSGTPALLHTLHTDFNIALDAHSVQS